MAADGKESGQQTVVNGSGAAPQLPQRLSLDIEKAGSPEAPRTSSSTEAEELRSQVHYEKVNVTASALAHSNSNTAGVPVASSPSHSVNGDNVTEETWYPEGGFKAWSVVFGSWCVLLSALGIMNTLASFQSYLFRNQLSEYSEGQIGWIFSVYAALSFGLGVIFGPIFDKYGATVLICSGSLGVSIAFMMFSLCTEYWHFMLDFGVLLGASTACIFSPSVAAVGHWFKARRGLATGIATTGGALGGVMWPLVLQYLIPQVGWAWTLRILGFIYMFLLALGCFFIRTRLPPLANATIMADFTILRFPAYAITVISIYLLEWALFIPITYISSYALHKGLSEAISYQCLIVLNVGSVFGRWLPGLYADKWGPFNTMAFTTIGSVVLVLAVWLPAGHTVAGLMTFSFFFGLSSGSNIGLTPVCVASLCRIEELGRYHSTCYAIVSIGCLTGIPIAGEILKANGGEYWGLILFTGMCYVGGSVGFIIVRVMEVGWDIRSKY